jgi:hypothetical protein
MVPPLTTIGAASGMRVEFVPPPPRVSVAFFPMVIVWSELIDPFGPLRVRLGPGREEFGM